MLLSPVRLLQQKRDGRPALIVPEDGRNSGAREFVCIRRPGGFKTFGPLPSVLHERIAEQSCFIGEASRCPHTHTWAWKDDCKSVIV